MGSSPMIQIPPDILNKYQHTLSQQSIPVQKQPYFVKWFRYYWAFCMKYNFNKNNPKSLSHFIQKLESGLVIRWATLGWGQACVIDTFVENCLYTQSLVKSKITQA